MIFQIGRSIYNLVKDESRRKPSILRHTVNGGNFLDKDLIRVMLFCYCYFVILLFCYIAILFVTEKKSSESELRELMRRECEFLIKIIHDQPDI